MSTLNQFAYSLESWVNSFLEVRYWKLKIVLTISLLAAGWFVIPQRYFFQRGIELYREIKNSTYKPENYVTYWKAHLEIAQNLFTKKDYPEDTHESKMIFRVTTPLLIKLLQMDKLPMGWGIIGLIGLNLIAGFFFNYGICTLIYRVSQDKFITFLFFWGFACSYSGINHLMDYWGWLDMVPYFFMLVPLLSNNFWICLGATSLAYLADERTIVNSALIIVIQYMLLSKPSLKHPLLIKKMAALAGAFIIWFAVRFFLRVYLDFHESASSHYLFVLTDMAPYLTRQVFVRTIAGNWLWIFLIVLLLHNQKPHLIFGVFLITFLANLAICTLVIDIMRTVGYFYLVTVLGLIVIIPRFERKQQIFILLIVAFFNMFSSSFG